MKAVDRDTELEHVSTAYFLENALATLAEKEKTVCDSKPKRPKAPIKPDPIKPHYDFEPCPVASVPLSEVPKPPFPKKWLSYCIVLLALPFLLMLLTAVLPNLGNALTVLLSFFTWAPFLLLVFCISQGNSERKAQWTAAQKEAENRIRNSEDFKRTCSEIQQRNHQNKLLATEQAKESNQAALEKYEKVLLPRYNEDITFYEKQQLPSWEKECSDVQTAISETQTTLQEVYDQNVIPGKYRNLDALTFISSFMGTSQYDLKFAIERYDKDIDQLIARENLNVNQAIAHMTNMVLQQQQYTNYLQAQTLEYIENGNKLLKQTRNWSIANTALIGIDLIHTLRQK